MKDGLSNLSVLAIYQDTLGRMWFGTNEGVNIYDGERLSTYKSYEIIDNQLRKKKFINGVVDQIVGDFYGDVFLKTDGALIKYDIRKERFKEIYPTGISSIAVLIMKSGVLPVIPCLDIMLRLTPCLFIRS